VENEIGGLSPNGGTREGKEGEGRKEGRKEG